MCLQWLALYCKFDSLTMTRPDIDLGLIVNTKPVKILCCAWKVVQLGMGVGWDTVQAAIPDKIYQRVTEKCIGTTYIVSL